MNHAYGAIIATSPLEKLTIQRRAVGQHDIKIDIAYCGVCHSDIHQVHSEWEGTQDPCVPGHEIVGRVTEIGEYVSKFKIGDLVGVSCIVDSCRHCADCEEGLENYCEIWLEPITFPLPMRLAILWVAILNIS